MARRLRIFLPPLHLPPEHVLYSWLLMSLLCCAGFFFEGGGDQRRSQQGQRSGYSEHISPPRGPCQRSVQGSSALRFSFCSPRCRSRGSKKTGAITPMRTRPWDGGSCCVEAGRYSSFLPCGPPLLSFSVPGLLAVLMFSCHSPPPTHRHRV